MLRIYICPKCYNFRMVSRKPDAICLHCGTVLDQIDMKYGDYMNMTEQDRKEFKDNYKKRMMLYKDRYRKIY